MLLHYTISPNVNWHTKFWKFMTILESLVLCDVRLSVITCWWSLDWYEWTNYLSNRDILCKRIMETELKDFHQTKCACDHSSCICWSTCTPWLIWCAHRRGLLKTWLFVLRWMLNFHHSIGWFVHTWLINETSSTCARHCCSFLPYYYTLFYKAHHSSQLFTTNTSINKQFLVGYCILNY